MPKAWSKDHTEGMINPYVLTEGQRRNRSEIDMCR